MGAIVYDGSEEHRLEFGTRVKDGDTKFALVIEITDLDGDYSDELQRAIPIYPQVKVMYSNGETETFTTHPKGRMQYDQEEFVCWDLEIYKSLSIR